MKPVMTPKIARTFGRASRVAAACLALATMASCTTAQTQGESSSYLVVVRLEAASGSQPNEFAGVLSSDVVTNVKATVNGTEQLVPTVFADDASVTFALALKDPGATGLTNTPSSTNFITVTRYHVNYIRADGRNVPGVDVPYPFDGAFTATVGATEVSANFNLVRIQAKEEAPLRALAGFGGAMVISTLAEVTFYGRDQAGREVIVKGLIGVNFADWGDPS